MSPSWNTLAASIRRDWHEQADPDGAVEVARSVIDALDELQWPGAAVAAVNAACECLWDSDFTDEARELADAFRVRVSDTVGFDRDDDSVLLRIEALLMSARAEHRADHGAAALAFALEARRVVIEHLGDYDAYRSALDEGARGEHCDHLCAVLSIAIPAARVEESQQGDNAGRWRAQVVSEALRLTINGRHEPRGDHAYALVNQLLMAVLAQGRPEDRTLVQLLVGMDALLRPFDPRSYATRRLVDMAIARWKGDVEFERWIAKLACEDLVEAGLRRHLRVLDERGHFPPRQQSA